MIITLIVQGFVTILWLVLNWFPDANINSITGIGTGLNTVLVTAISYWNGFAETFPYADALLTTFLMLVGFEITLMVAKFILGHRLPIRNT